MTVVTVVDGPLDGIPGPVLPHIADIYTTTTPDYIITLRSRVHHVYPATDHTFTTDITTDHDYTT